jgi:hypothetical protein
VPASSPQTGIPCPDSFDARDSKTIDSPEHPLKQSSGTSRRAAGTQIDESDEQPENAWFSIRASFETGSNLTVESFQHPLKQYGNRTSTEEGMSINSSDEQLANA